MLLLILILFAGPAYIFSYGGFSKETVIASIAWVMVSSGVMAFKGGEKRAGAVVAAIGVILTLFFIT